jgi:protein-tyrosine kinase
MEETGAGHLVERAAARMRAVAGDPSLTRLMQTSEAPSGPARQADKAPYASDQAVSPPHVSGITVTLAAMSSAGLAMDGSIRSKISEECRITAGWLFRNLHTSRRQTAAPNLLMVTSARPGEGKTFCVINIAASLARSGLTSVVVVDVDPKLRSLSSVLGLSDRPGLYDFAADPKQGTQELILSTEIPGLFVLPLGRRAAAEIDAGVTRAISAAIETVARSLPQSVVILDAPPCLSTSDPSALAGIVSQIALVVEAERTQRSEVDSAVELLQACPNIVTVFNKATIPFNAFGSYDYFGS